MPKGGDALTAAYSGGAVNLNSHPFMNMYFQQLAHKRAQDFAIDQYFRKLNTSINAAGVRGKDIPYITKHISNMQSFFNSNGDAIKNPRLDNGRALTMWENMRQTALADIAESKERGQAPMKVAGKIKPDDMRRMHPDMVEALRKNDLPLGDPEGKTFQESDIKFNAKPYSYQESIALRNSLLKDPAFKPAKTLISKPTELGDGYVKATYTSTRTPDQLKKVGDYYKGVASTDGPAMETAKLLGDRYANDPVFRDQIDKTHQSVYGTPVQTAQDIYAASEIPSFMGGTSEDKTMTSEQYKRETRLTAVAMHEAGMNQRHNSNLTQDSNKAARIVDGFYQKLKGGGNVDIPPVMIPALKSNGAEPIHASDAGNGDVEIHYPKFKPQSKDYETDASGRPVVDPSLTVKRSRQELEDALGVKISTKKQFNEQRGQQTPPDTNWRGLGAGSLNGH